MNLTRITAAALVAATLAGPALAAPAPAPFEHEEADAERGPGPRDHGPFAGPHMEPPGLPFLRGIDLSEAQEDRLFAILHAAAPQQREQEKAERKALAALDAMHASGRVDEAQAAAHAKALGQAIAAQELLRVRTAAQAMALLTPQQKAALERERPARTPRD